jgi:redox-sensitive bicupin YhaK (pirin superfamily)
MQNVIKDVGQPVGEAKALVGLYRPGSTHMVGDGFPVRNLFPSNDLDREVSPFLMLDYAGPEYFAPTDHPRGVGEHPHRGFETVTIVYEGMVAHRDSAGNSGVIGPGDVQWMTAASGIVHEELHEKEFAKKGGTLHAIQLWVNLPRASKMSSPGYQTLLDRDIPVVELEGEQGRVRVIAGTFGGVRGPAKTFTPVHLYDVQLKAGARREFHLPDGYNTAVFLLQGAVTANGSQELREAGLAVYGGQGTSITVEAVENSRLLVMSGEPIHEPIARYGPFVMNTREELVQAVEDYQAGRMGHLS